MGRYNDRFHPSGFAGLHRKDCPVSADLVEIDEGFVARLRAICGSDAVMTSRAERELYAFDGTAAIRQRPAVVVEAITTDQVQAVVRLAAEHRVAIVPRGSGTGLSGGSVPSEGCVVLCLNKMNKVLEVDAANLTMLVEPGVITHEVDRLASQHGLFYPPDPGSQKISTIGGNVAENSGGLRGLKYGVTRNYVMGLEVVLPSGEVTWLGNKCVKDVAGYSLRDLFIGSEGTLGLVTKVLLRLVPRPAARQTMLAVYDQMRPAAATVAAIIAEPIIPCTLEFLDQQTIGCVEDFAKIGLPRDAGAVLIMETDGDAAVVEREAAAMAAIARTHGARDVQVAANDHERDQLLSARRSAFSALARVRPTTILEDVTVPRSALPDMVEAVAEIARTHRLQIGTFGHMGDGNLHPTFLVDERDSDEMSRVEHALSAIVDKALSLGGTITGEHGVGLAKKPYLARQLDAASYQLLRHIKQAIDPLGIMNPGKIF
jgi:glycolate oxidase